MEASAKQEDWQPVVRKPIYREILEELCHRTEGLTCTRRRAWKFLVSDSDFKTDFTYITSLLIETFDFFVHFF